MALNPCSSGMRTTRLLTTTGRLGERLAQFNNLYRRPGYANGLLLLLEDGKHVVIAKGADLAPVIVDRVRVLVFRGGKPKGSKIAAAHLNTMLTPETFLGQFRMVDQVTTTPVYLPDFTLTQPGLNEGGGQRILYVGEEPVVSDSMDAINAFLDVMPFESEADRTNAVADCPDRHVSEPPVKAASRS